MPKTYSRMYRQQYDRINLKAKESNKLFLISTVILIIAFLSAMFFSSYGNILSDRLNIEYKQLQIIVLIIAIIVIFIGGHILSKAKKCKPLKEEQVFIYAFKVVDNIENYLDEPVDVFRKKALKNIPKISRELNYWDSGNLKFINEPLGESLSQLKREFKYKLSSIIKRGNEENINDLIPFFNQFLNFLVSEGPTFDEFSRVVTNFQDLNEIPLTTTFQLMGIRQLVEKLSSTIIDNKFILHILHLVAFFIVSFLIYYIGCDVLKIEKGFVYPTAALSFVMLIIFKLSSLGKRNTEV